MPNAAAQARLKAGARDERTLEAVACSRLLNEALRAVFTHPTATPVLKDLLYSRKRLYLLSSTIHHPSWTGGRAMTLLRQRMIEDRQRRGLSERTQEMSVRAVRHLADHDQTAPEQITEEERRDDFLSLTHVKHASRSASTIALYGITCFYEHPLKRDWTTLTFVRPPQDHTRPVILSLEDVHTILQDVR